MAATATPRNERRAKDVRAVVIDDGSPVLHDRLPG
jgi:hypothetical protein